MSSLPTVRDPLIGDIDRLHISGYDGLPNEAPRWSNKTVRKNHRARDITDDFTRASQDLETGELVKEEAFTLWDSVQALEIMDPKMDSGFVPDGEAFDTGYDVSRNLLPTEVVYIMDQVIGSEMAWQRGFALCQTLFTSCHIHHLLVQCREPKTLPNFGILAIDGLGNDAAWLHLCLRAFCINTIIQCDMAIEVVSSQQYYEEEDLNTQTYQIELLTDITDDMSIGLLDRAIAWVQEREMDAAKQAVLHRLELRRATMLRFIVGQRGLPISALQNRIRAVKDTQTTAAPLEAAFNARTYRKLSSTGPTREAACLSLDDACNDLSNLLESVAEQQRVLSDIDIVYHSDALRAFLWQFAHRTPRPSTLARAILQAQLFAGGCPLEGAENMEMYMLRELATLHILPNDMLDGSYWLEDLPPSHPKFEIGQVLNEWMGGHQAFYVDIIHSLCQNPCRVRRCLINALESLNSADTAPSPFTKPGSPEETLASLRSAAMHDQLAHLLYLKTTLQRINLVVSILHLGLAHNLHAAHELPFVYHLLSTEYTSALNTTNILKSLLHAYTTQKLTLTPSIPSSDFEPSATLKHAALDARTAYFRAMTTTSTAFSTLYAALARVNLLPSPPPDERSRKRQYDLRSREWGAGLPAFVRPPFAEMEKAALRKGESVKDILAGVDKGLDRARAGLLRVLAIKSDDVWACLGLGRCTADEGMEERWSRDGKAMLKKVVEMRTLVLRRLDEIVREVGAGEDGLNGRVSVVVPEDEGTSWGAWIVPKVAFSDKP